MDSVHGLNGLGPYPFSANLIQAARSRSDGQERREAAPPAERRRPRWRAAEARRNFAGTAFPVAKSPMLGLYRERRRRGIHLRRRRGSAMAGRRCSTERKKARGGSSWRERSGGRYGSAVGRPASRSLGEGEGRLGWRE